MSYSIKVNNFDKIIKGLGKSKSIVKQEMGNAIIKSSLLAKREAKKAAPVKTGNLQKSIKTFKRGSFTAGAKAFAEYAGFVEFGTKPHTIKTRTKNVLASKTQVFGKQVYHPGTRANPFMGRTFKKILPKVDKIFDKSAKKIAKKYLGK